MATLISSYEIESVLIENEQNRSYNPALEQSWNELKEILEEFGISFTSLSEVEFSNTKYKLRAQGNSEFLVYFGDVLIANGYVSKVKCQCDNDIHFGMVIKLNDLKSVYGREQSQSVPY